MNVTESLLRVYRVDRQLAGLKGRLTSAQRFLDGQVAQVASLDAKHKDMHQRLLKLKAEAGEQDVEIASLDERITLLRDRMNSASTNKEYKALLTEVNTHKAERGHLEDTALKLITRIEELDAEDKSLIDQRAERDKMRQVAEHERDEHKTGVQGRVDELERERDEVAKDVTPGALDQYEALFLERNEEAMGSVEIVDHKRHEYNCGSCMIALPVESVSTLLGHGSLTVCVSCGCILYLEEATVEALQPASKR